ncbi:MAG: hypothetical protein EAX96_02465 [Candidatus Lokiarchaeota archaeon]|nr:hypothetical protein [Candidatus Lokiarchaeota archaeon]
MSSFDYFKICKECDDEECCKEPYYAFLSKIEILKIKEYLLANKFEKKFQNFISKGNFTYNDEKTEVFSIKKDKGKCIFLKDNRFCMIQNVKPLDCRQWPLTFDYLEKEDKLIIYRGVCPLSDVLDENWIKSMIEIIKKEVKNWPLQDLAAYTSYDRDDTLREIKIFENFLGIKDK